MENAEWRKEEADGSGRGRLALGWPFKKLSVVHV